MGSEPDIEIDLLGRWRLSVPRPADGDKWFLDWALHAPAQVGAHLRQGQAAMRALADGGFVPRAVHHPFGGLGGQALVAQSLWPNAVQTIDEFSEGAVAHLKSWLPLSPVRHVDSYKASLPPADLYVADFGDCTAHRMADVTNPRRQLFERMLAHEPGAILLTDIAGPRMHMPKIHASYQRATGFTFPINDYPAYLTAYAHWIARTFGYRASHIFWQRWSAIMVLRPIPPYASLDWAGMVPKLVPLDALPPVPGGGPGFAVLS